MGACVGENEKLKINQDMRIKTKLKGTFVKVCIVMALSIGTVLGQDSKGAGKVDMEVIEPVHPLLSGPVKMKMIGQGYLGVGGMTWDKNHERLYFSDTGSGVIYRWVEGKLETYIFSSENEKVVSGKALLAVSAPTGLAVDKAGKLVVCDQKQPGIRRRESKFRWKDISTSYKGAALNGPVRVHYSSNGNYFFTDAPSMKDPSGTAPGIYRRARNGRLSQLYSGLTSPSGLALSDDEKTLFVTNYDEQNPAVFTFQFKKNGQLEDPIEWPIPDGSQSMWTMPVMDIVNIGSGCFAVTQGEVIYFVNQDGKLVGKLKLTEKITSFAYAENINSLFVGAHSLVLQISPEAVSQ